MSHVVRSAGADNPSAARYPSTAELASFRLTIAGDYETMGGPDLYAPYDGGAWQGERISGIGYSGGSPTAPFLIHEADGGPFPMGYAVSCAWADAYDHSWARKAAGAMRSREYSSRLYAGYNRATILELTYGSPTGTLEGERINAAALASI